MAHKIVLDDAVGFENYRENNYDDDIPDCVEEEDIFGEFDDEDDECEISFISNGGDNPEDDKFDAIIGALEDIMMDPVFNEKQQDFFYKHCQEFDDTEENKLVYTEIFNNYTLAIESYIEQRLASVIPDFSMQEFLDMIAAREEECNGEVFDMLLSFGDFSTFKEYMLSYKQEMCGGGIHFEISVTKLDVSMEDIDQSVGFNGLQLNGHGAQCG